MISIPTIETNRLILRAPARQDEAAFVAFYATERAAYVGGKMPTWRASTAFAGHIGHWQLRGFGWWTVTLNDDDTALGMVGANYPTGWPERELGWLLFENAEGKGIAYEAAQAARDYVFGTLGWDTAVSYIAPENLRSIALAERLGARLDAGAAFPGEDPMPVYRHAALIGGDGGMEAYV